MTREVEQAPSPPEKATSDSRPGAPARAPRWPAWYAPAAFLTALLAVFVIAAIVQVIVAATGHDLPTSGPGVELGGTFVQDGLLVVAGVVFAARVAPPRPWQFGVRRARRGRVVGGVLAAYGAFWLFSLVYQVALNPHGKQTVAKDLGANNGGILLVLAAILVIVVAPACEELFFRGFFYGALRSRFTPVAAALIDGLVFGGIHYTGAQTLAVLPPLAMLGFVFCLLYEYTGSIFPTIALHAVNNSISYAVTVDASAGVAAGLGVAVVAACAIVPRFVPAPPTPALR
ncbi:MAG TPA: type II CAAX endopeptidase family protein [Candidatus Limnocylindria bacterium]|nr:type II CAAX endopeptidase family protein [Candidatus Limnocylindria bacterium]